MHFLAAFLIVIAAATSSFAATRNEPAFLRPELVVNHPWREGISLILAPDGQECRKKYGSRWRQKCAAAPGIAGHAAKGLKLSPRAAGRWEWRDGRTCDFIPDDGRGLRPDTSYEIDISGLALPGYISLGKNRASVRTAPLAARLIESRFWIDPDPAGRHRLNLAFDFNYPVADLKFQPDLQLPRGAQASAPELLWSADRDRLSVSWILRSLPAITGQAVIRLPGCASFRQGEKGLEYAAGAVFNQGLPAAEDIFGIKGCRIVAEEMENLDERYILELETSLYTNADEILKRLVAVELPEFKSRESLIPYNWSQARAASPEAIRNGRALKPASLQGGSEKKSKFRFALPAASGRHVLIAIAEGLPAASGHKLTKTWADIIEAKPLAARVGFLQPGHVLSPASSLDLHGSDLDAVEWRLEHVREPFLALLAQSSWDTFESPLAGSDLAMESIAASLTGTIPMVAKGQGRAQFATLSPGAELRKAGEIPSGLVYATLKGMKAGKEVATSSRLILLTDLGLIVKRSAEGALDCFAGVRGAPASGARISILGANGKPVACAATDARGHARFDGIDGLMRELRPVAAIAEYNGDLAWLPLGDRQRQISFQDQETGGSHVGKDGLLAHVFSQSGVFRPGDTARFGVMARKADFSLLPESLPLFAEIVDPAGRAIWETVIQAGADGLAEIAWRSLPEALSGRYNLNIRPARKGAVLGSLTFRMEHFQPDTLKLRVSPPEVRGWLVAPPDRDLKIRFGLCNLYGDAAAGHRIRPRVATAPAVFRFSGYDDYIFTDPAPFLGGGQERKLPELETDEAGNALVSVPADLLQASARVTVAADGYEKSGGRATSSAATFLLSPAERVLGYRVAGALTNLDFINAGDKAQVELLALDPSLKPVACKKLAFTLYKLGFTTSLVADGSGGFRYDETPREQPERSWNLDLPARPLACELETSAPGSYVLEIGDGKGGKLARIPYTVAGEKLVSSDEPLAESKMRIRLNKRDYKAGEEMAISFSLPYDASGIISLERDTVEAFEWVEGHAGDNVARIRIPEGFTGKGYAVLTLARKDDSPVIYQNPLACAAASFQAALETKAMGLELEIPDGSVPGKDLEVRIKSRRAGSAILFAVDEGILQLAPWKGPGPLADLLGDRALDVRTLQFMDLLMPDHGQISRRISSFGGGMDVTPFGARFQNPFRRKSEPPLVFWSGIIPVGQEATTVQIPVAPWHSGNLRIYAVSSCADGADVATGECKVAAPLVLTPVMPLNVVPGDEFGASLVIANTTDRNMAVSLELEKPDSLEISSPLPGSINVPARSEAVARFQARVLDLPGEAAIGFRAKAADGKYEREVSFSVRPASGFRSTFQAGVAASSLDLPEPRSVYPFLARSEASISGLPLPLASGLSRYLETYPYGCTEQLVSRAFAQVALFAWPNVGIDPEKRAQLLSATRDAIAARFNGQFVSLWPNGEGDLLTTIYAADYLLTLREKGLGEPGPILATICDSLDWNCALNSPDLDSARASAYAIWVLAREGRVVAQKLEELASALDERGVEGWRQDLAGAFMAAARKEMAMPASLSPGSIVLAPSGWFDEFAQASMLACISARYFPESLGDAERRDYFERSSASLVNGAFATFSAAQGVRALAQMAAAAAPDVMGAKIRCVAGSGDGSEDIYANGAFYRTRQAQCARYRLELQENSGPVFWQISNSGYDRVPGASAAANGLAVDRVFLDDSGAPVRKVRKGDEVVGRITLRAEKGPLKDCVISDLLPGGFEMIMPGPGKEEMPRGVKFLDRQEDRILVFLDADADAVSLEYRCRAVHPGDFIVPPVTAEAMYDRATNGNGEPGRLEITESR